MRLTTCTLLSWSLLLATVWTAHAQQDDDFYRHNPVTMVIGSGSGGGYDLSARLVAQHLSKHIPGNPAVLVRNMPGASTLVAAQNVYNLSPRDGSVIAMLQPTFLTDWMLNPSLKFDPERFSWIGRVDASTLFGVVRRDRVMGTLEAAKQTQMTLAGSGPNGSAATIPWALNRMIGTKFKVVLGYESSAAMGLAMERGEADGNGSTSWEYLQSKPNLLENDNLAFLYVILLNRSPLKPDVPSVVELATTDRDRQALRLIAATSFIGRSVIAPPDVPPGRLAILRNAFDSMVRDPEFLSDSAKRNLGVDPLPVSAVVPVVSEVAHASRELVEYYKLVTAQP